jgi:hypothetical protein
MADKLPPCISITATHGTPRVEKAVRKVAETFEVHAYRLYLCEPSSKDGDEA